MEHSKERLELIKKMAPIDNTKFDDILVRLYPLEYPLNKIINKLNLLLLLHLEVQNKYFLT